MSEYYYAKGRITESITFITEEIKEFETDYAFKTWKEYHEDKKLQKLMDRTIENVLVSLIEICGAVLTEEKINSKNYVETLKNCGKHFALSAEEQENLAKLAVQRNRLAHRYLNYRWQAVKIFAQHKELIVKLICLILEREKKQ